MTNGKYSGEGMDELIKIDDKDVIQYIQLSEIRKNPYQPRTEFKEEKLHELSESIKEHGILQPIIVRQSIKGYDIVAGERRFRATEIAGMETIPVIVKEMTDQEMMELAIIENLQRENLNPLEEAVSYKELMEQLQMTQSEIAKRLGKSRPYIANMIRILNLPVKIKNLINDGKLTGGHGRTLLGIKDQVQQEEAARKAVREEMSVRALEQYVKMLTQPKKSRSQGQAKKKPKFIQKHEARLKERFGTTVEIKKARKKGVISFEFKNEEEFKRIIDMLEK
ncbi:ParB/RepB/Spo0J family partition protein [Corticicoccus populi]|uniref:ParB/RepB/Spo0J family partition protein n=1 Tax=Corticicoccus populi TaxID=1812821 RepID=A0ABW5WXV7_9STAP